MTDMKATKPSWLHPEKRLYVASVVLSKLLNWGKKPTALADKASLRNILIVRLDEIGDMVTSLPAIALLRASHPTARITMWCKPLCKPLMEAVPEVDAVVCSEEELRAGLKVSEYGKIDLWVELRGSWVSLRLAALLRPRYRVDRATVRLRNSKLPRHPHEVVTNCQVIAPVIGDLPQGAVLHPKLHLQDAHIAAAEAFLRMRGIRAPFALLHPTANKPLKRWPIAQFAALAKELHSRGMAVVLVGTPSEQAALDELATLCPLPTHSTAGALSLPEFAALASKAALYVGNDSGPMHIAAAVGAPVVGLFGPAEPHVFAPKGPRAAYLQHLQPCCPCDQVHCVQGRSCVELIQVNEVLKVADLVMRIA